MTLAEMKGVAARALKGRHIRGGKIRANCPFCADKIGKPDDRMSLVYFHDTKRVACYRCDTWLFLKGTRSSAYGGDSEREPKVSGPISIPKGCFPSWHESVRDSLSAGPGYRYLTEERGVPPAVAREAQIHIGAYGELAGCIVIPILADDDKTWLGYVARAWGFKAYRNATSMTRGRFFNHGALSLKTNIPLIVVEGCLDALPTWPNGAACLGKPTEEHLDLLARCERPVVLGLDADAEMERVNAAMQVIMRRCDLRRRGVVPEQQMTGCIAFPPRTDPGDFSGAETMAAARRSIGGGHSKTVGVGELFPKWPGPGVRFDCVLPASDADVGQAHLKLVEKTL